MFSVNNLRLGTITATDYCLGSVPVQKMYLGSVLVFDRTPAEEVRYFFEVSPTADMEFEALDSEKTLTVTSYSQVYSEDAPSGSVTPITPSIQESDFTTHDIVNNSDGTFTITLKANDYYQNEDGSLSKRNGTITVSLSLSGDSTEINVSQSPIIPTVLNRWLRLEYAAEEDQYITVNKGDVELPYVSDWKNYVFPKKSTGIKPIRWNADITNQDFMHEVLAYMSLQTIVYVDETENAQENKSTYTAADSMCIATSTGDGLYFLELLKGSGIENGEITFKIDGNGYWGQFYKCFDGCSWNKITIQFMQDNIRISSMNGAFRGCIINELNILDANGDPATTKYLAARDLSGMCEWTYIDNFPDIIDWESLDQNLTTGFGWAFSYAIPITSIAQHGDDREASGNTIRCSTLILAFLRCTVLQSIGPVLDLSRVPGLSSDNGKAFEQCTALTDVRIRNLNGPTWHFDDDTLSGNIPNLDQASVTYLFDNLMDLTTYNAEDTSGAKPKSDHGDLYCPAEWQDKITSEMIIAAAAKNWNIYVGGELQQVTEYLYVFECLQDTLNVDATASGSPYTVRFNSYRTTYINGVSQNDRTRVNFTTDWHDTIPSWFTVDIGEYNGSDGFDILYIVQQNDDTVSREYTHTVTQIESGKTTSLRIVQSTATITYSDITITGFSYDNVVPASGGTATPTVTYSQTFGYNGATTGGGTITSGATLLFAGGAVNASNGQYTYASRGTTAGDQINNEVTVTVTLHGKTATAKAIASQEANAITSTTYKDALILLEANPMTIPATGGTSELTTYATRTRVDTYTSTATKETEESSAPYTTISGTGFSLSASSAMNITITAEKNTGAQRTATITSKAYDVAETLTITLESGQTISSYGDITINGGSATDIPASGGTVKASGCTATIQVTYSSGSTGTVTVPTGNITYTEVNAASLGTTVKARTKVGTSTCNVSYQGKSASKLIDVYQAANVKTEGEIEYGDLTPEFKLEKTTAAVTGDEIEYTARFFRNQSRTDTWTSGESEVVDLGIDVEYGTADYVTPGTHNRVDWVTKDLADVSSEYEYKAVIAANTTSSSRSFLIELYYSGYGYIQSETITQESGKRQYAKPVISEVSMNDVPASGMTAGSYLSNEPEFQLLINSFKVTQTWGYGSTTGGGTKIYTWPDDDNLGVALIKLSANVPSKGTTTSSRTNTNQQLRLQVGPNLVDGHTMLDLYQEANTRTAGDIKYGDWLVDVSVNPDTIDSAGGTRTINRTASRTRTLTYNYTSGATSQEAMSNETGTPTLSSNQTWCTLNNNNATIARNDTTSSRTVTITGTYQGKSDTCTITQSARQIESYGDINISGGSVSGDIPASGGSKSASGCTATIRVNYDNDTYENVSVPSSNISYSSVSGSNLGTTSKARTKVGTSRCTVSYQGKTATKDFDVYQQANSSTATNIAYGTWQVSVSANPTSVAASGGTSTITRSATRTRKLNYTWTSGATSQSDLSNETATPALSVSGTGFSLNGTTVTATSNVPAKTYTLQVSNPTGDLEEGPDQELTTTVTSTYTQPSSNSRSCTVTATHGGVSKQVTISLSGQSQSSGNQDWTVAKGTNMQTATKNGSTITMVPNAEYGNKNETYTATCTVTQTTSNKTATVTGTWYKGYLNVSPATLDFTADGGTKIIDIDTNLNWQVMP